MRAIYNFWEFLIFYIPYQICIWMRIKYTKPEEKKMGVMVCYVLFLVNWGIPVSYYLYNKSPFPSFFNGGGRSPAGLVTLILVAFLFALIYFSLKKPFKRKIRKFAKESDDIKAVKVKLVKFYIFVMSPFIIIAEIVWLFFL